MHSDLPTDDDQIPGAAAGDDDLASSTELTDEEWAELERATDPDIPVVPSPSSESLTTGDPSAIDGGWVEAAEQAEAAITPPNAETTPTTMPDTVPHPADDGAIDPDESEPGHASVDLTDTAPLPDAAHTPDRSQEALDDRPEAEAATAESDRLRMPLPRVIAVANQKGGVGKTTTTVNIAACLAEQGYRTLLVDLDPQANASTGLGLEPRELEHSIYHVMLHDQDADSCIEPTEVKNLFVLPSSLDLAGAEIELVSLLSREHRLRLAIESVIDDYDYVLIDCPPSLGLLTINALTAAREVLVPIQCEYYALEGLGQLMRNVDLVRASLNPKLQISHIVLVMFDPRTKLAGQVVDEVRAHFGSTVCENVIPRTVRLSEAPSFGQPITTFDSDSRGAAAYRAVTQEVLNGQA